MTGIQDGWIFPSLEELAKGNSAPTMCMHYSYDSVLEDFKYLCILKKDLDSLEGKYR
jgi:hypothetical protein